MQEHGGGSCYVGMQVNYCGTVWTIAAMAGGAMLNAGYTFVICNMYGETERVSGASLSPA
ncbi:uncharacterized protein Aud_003991 [Aspergillus udagawae]|uniref:Uncharacterized protein n=1 Tax=Aspergillus udagawae TaxID=91492 RepID=A0A8E0QRA0_9EURO|nr:uncharacterized protein Aud_003991 [Aspergillus udagawae]GIC87606.1 hypothetical protein Aud_003991 [Aspergillus udagawae]